MKNNTNPYIMNKCGKRVRECLEEKGISQANLAKKINYTQQHISYVINGKRALSREMAEAIVNVLNVNPEMGVETVYMPYWELEENEYDFDDVDEHGYVSINYDVPFLYRAEYLLCESDVKQGGPIKADNNNLEKAIAEVLSKYGYDLAIGMKYNCYIDIIKSYTLWKDTTLADSTIVRRLDGKELVLNALEVTELFKDYISAIRRITERLFERQEQLDYIKKAKEDDEKRMRELSEEIDAFF